MRDVSGLTGGGRGFRVNKKRRRSHKVQIDTFSAHNRCLLSRERMLHSVTGSSIGKLSPSPDFHVTQSGITEHTSVASRFN